MSSNKLRPAFFVAGLLGLPLCIWAWLKVHHIAWLVGVSISTFLLVVSVGEAIAATKRDVAALRQNQSNEGTSTSRLKARVVERKPLRQNAYFRAGIMGLPFCIFEWFWRHDLRFLLGGGFFAGILFPTLYAQWKWQREKNQSSVHDSTIGA